MPNALKQYHCINICTFRKGFDIEIPKVSCYNASNEFLYSKALKYKVHKIFL